MPDLLVPQPIPALPTPSGISFHLDGKTGLLNAAGQPASSGEAVAKWVDQERGVEMPVSSGTPIAVAGGGVAFDGASTFYNPNLGRRLTFADAATVAICCKITTPYGNTLFNFNCQPSNTRFQANVPWSDSWAYFDFGGIGVGERVSTEFLAEWDNKRHGFIFSRMSPEWQAIFLDGDNSLVFENSKTGALPDENSQAFIGNNFTGEIYEIVVWETGMGVADRAAVGAYFDAKWRNPHVTPTAMKLGGQDIAEVWAPRAGLPPSDIAGLTFHLDAAVGLENAAGDYPAPNDPVVRWVDQVTGLDLVNFNTPTFSVNGGVYFPPDTGMVPGATPFPQLLGSNQGSLVIHAAFVLGGSFSLAMRCNTRDTDVRTQALIPWNATDWAFDFGGTGAGERVSRPVADLLTGTNTYFFERFSGGGQYLYVNQGGALGGAGKTGTVPTNEGSNPIVGGSAFEGVVYEVAYFNRALSATDRQNLSDYWARKWSNNSELPPHIKVWP